MQPRQVCQRGYAAGRGDRRVPAFTLYYYYYYICAHTSPFIPASIILRGYSSWCKAVLDPVLSSSLMFPGEKAACYFLL